MTTARPRRRVPPLVALALAAACGDAPTTDRPREPEVLTLSPAAAVVGPGERACLAARDGAGRAVAASALAWSVRDETGAAPDGAPLDAPPTVDADGCLAAPPSVPWTRALVVAARRAGPDGAAGEGTARVLLAPTRAPVGTAWTLWEPRVVDLAAPAPHPVRLTVVADRDLTGVTLRYATTLGGGEPPAPVALRALGPRVWRAELPPASLVRGYRAGEVHAFVGHLELTDARGTTQSIASVNVRDARMPDVPVQRLDDRAQATPHVLNLREDDVLPWFPTPHAVVRRVYEHLPDAYDFVAVVDAVQQGRNRYYSPVRNAVRGIGLDPHDDGAAYGSAARLQGLVRFPIDWYFDGAGKEMSHELGHRWINWSRLPALRGLGGHWPVGDVAYGVMGYGLPPSGEGGDFQFTVAADGGGYVLRAAEYPREFNDLELYLMGLGPADAVRPQVVFADQTQFLEQRDGQRVRGAATTVTIGELIAAQGPRVPAYGASQTTFRVATVVLSAGRLLTAAELAFFDHVAARGEATTELPFASGGRRGTTKPFHLATRGRARLVMRLR